jgi:Divergent InlB B-repeat domain
MPPVINPQPPSEPGSQSMLTNAVISIQINGLGRVTPNLNGKTLPIGKLITLRALPAPGQVFAGWSGLLGAAELPLLALVLQTNLSLTANFVASPFTTLNGAYAGLLANTNAISPADSGAFKVNVNPSGTFSGRVIVAGQRHGIHGQFNLFGDAVISISRNQLPPLTLNLHLDPAANDSLISGQITDGAWISELLGERNVFNSKLNPAQQAGVRSFLLEQTGSQMAAVGTASSHIAKSGSARVSGKLSNLRSFSTATVLGKTGDYPFYLSFNHGLDVVIGWLNFPANQQTASTGSVFWVSSGTNAFSKSLQVNSL